MRRPAAVLALLAATGGPALSACSDPAATMPVATPSTRGGTPGPATATTGASGAATSEAPLAPPSSVAEPRAHDAAAVATYFEGYSVAGLTRVAGAEGSPARAVVGACPGGPAVERAAGDTAYAGVWEGPGGLRADVAAITYPDLPAAAKAVDPVLDGAADCVAPKPAGGVTTKVDDQRRDVAEGMPLGRVDVTRTTADATSYDYVGVVQVGNVLLRMTYTSPDAKMGNEKGSTALALLARDVQGL